MTRIVIALLLVARVGFAFTLNPMLQKSMVLQRPSEKVRSYIAGTASAGATVTVQWPCADPVAGNPCSPEPVYTRLMSATDQGITGGEHKWQYNITTADYTDISTITTVTSGQRMRITIAGDDNSNCAHPSGWLENDTTLKNASNTTVAGQTDVAGVVQNICVGGTNAGNVCTTTGDCPGTGTTCVAGCVIDITGVVVGEVVAAIGQSALVPRFMGNTCILSESSIQMCEIWPAIRTSSELRYTWHDNIAPSVFWLGIELYNKLRAPIGMVQRAVGATSVNRWSGDSLCEEPEMFNVISNPALWNGVCTNKCSGGTNNGNVCLDTATTGIDYCPGGTCQQDGHAFDPDIDQPKQIPFGGAWGDLYQQYVYPMWPFGVHWVWWFQGTADSGDDATYRHALASMVRSWRKDRNNYIEQIGGFPIGDLPVIWTQNAPKGYGARRCTQCPPDTRDDVPERSLSVAEPTPPVGATPGGFANLQTDEFDDPSHAAYVAGYYGQCTGGCRLLAPLTPGPGATPCAAAPTPGSSACVAAAVPGKDGRSVAPCDDCYMANSSDLEDGLHPHNTQPYARNVAMMAFTQIYGMTALSPGFSNAFSGPNLIGMRLGTPAGGQLPISLCFRPGTAEGLFGMRIPGYWDTPDPSCLPGEDLRGFVCFDNASAPKWQKACASVNQNQILVRCPMTSPQLIRYGKSRFEAPYVMYGNVFNGDTMPLADFIVDVENKNLDSCVLANTPTPTATPTGPTVTPTATPTGGTLTPTPTPTVTNTPVLSSCMTALTSPSGAVAGYHFDELVGVVAYDSIGSNDGNYSDGVLLGAASLLPGGDTDLAASFPTGSIMQVNATDPAFFSTEESMRAFIQTTDPNAQIINHQDSAGATTRMALRMSGGLITLTAGVGSSCTPTSISTSATFNDGNPHFVAGVFSASQQLKLYVDNYPVIQSSTSLGVLCASLLAGVVDVGANADLSAFSNAIIDEPWIYGRALTSGEVATMVAACPSFSRIALVPPSHVAVFPTFGPLVPCPTSPPATPAAPYACAVAAGSDRHTTDRVPISDVSVVMDVGAIRRCDGTQPGTYYCWATATATVGATTPTPTPASNRFKVDQQGPTALDDSADFGACDPGTFVSYLCTGAP